MQDPLRLSRQQFGAFTRWLPSVRNVAQLDLLVGSCPATTQGRRGGLASAKPAMGGGSRRSRPHNGIHTSVATSATISRRRVLGTSLHILATAELLLGSRSPAWPSTLAIVARRRRWFVSRVHGARRGEARLHAFTALVEQELGAPADRPGWLVGPWRDLHSVAARHKTVAVSQQRRAVGRQSGEDPRSVDKRASSPSVTGDAHVVRGR